jgi:hypothetical protein
MVMAAAALAFFMMMVMAAAAFVIIVMMVMPAAALAFLMLMVMAAAAFVIVVVMVVPAAALAFLVLVVMAAAAFVIVMVMVVAAAALVFLMLVVVAASAAALALAVVMVVMAAAAVAALDAHRLEGLFDLGRLEADHPEHLLEVGQRQHRKALGRLGDFDAAVDERRGGFLHRAQVARDVEHLFDGRAHDPELARIVEEHVVDVQRALFLDGDGNLAALGFERIAPAHALGGSENDRLSAVQDRLGGRGIGRKKLGKSRHF